MNGLFNKRKYKQTYEEMLNLFNNKGNADQDHNLHFAWENLRRLTILNIYFSYISGRSIHGSILENNLALSRRAEYPHTLSVCVLCPTLCDPMDCSPPGSSVHGDSPGSSLTTVFLKETSTRKRPQVWIGRQKEIGREYIFLYSG